MDISQIKIFPRPLKTVTLPFDMLISLKRLITREAQPGEDLRPCLQIPRKAGFVFISLLKSKTVPVIIMIGLKTKSRPLKAGRQRFYGVGRMIKNCKSGSGSMDTMQISLGPVTQMMSFGCFVRYFFRKYPSDPKEWTTLPLSTRR